MDLENTTEIEIDDEGNSENYSEDFAADYERYVVLLSFNLFMRFCCDSVRK